MPNAIASMNRSRARRGLLVFAALATMFAMPAHAVDQDLIDYASACAAEIAEVPAFNCLDGKVIPMEGGGNKEGLKCNAPPYLPVAGCFNYSRLGELAKGNKDVGIVFLCRHKEAQPEKSNQWQDIAVIQTNFRSGATCFFQQLANKSTLSGDVKPPSSGNEQWLTPKEMASYKNACIQCHDSGAFLRTPYLKPVAKELDAFKNFGSRQKNERANYWFPGSKFLFYVKGKNWNGSVHRVADTNAGNACTQCHEMGTNAINKNLGTSLWLGPYATGLEPTPSLQNGSGANGDLAYWMRLSLTKPNEDSMRNATTMRECALQTVSGGTCTQIPFEGQIAELGRMAHDALMRHQTPDDTPDKMTTFLDAITCACPSLRAQILNRTTQGGQMN